MGEAYPPTAADYAWWASAQDANRTLDSVIKAMRLMESRLYLVEQRLPLVEEGLEQVQMYLTPKA